MSEQTAQLDHNKNWYDKYYKLILLIPLALLLFSVIYLYFFISASGDLFKKDVSLTGGATITVFDGSVDLDALKNSLSQQFSDLVIRAISDLRTGEQQAFFAETSSDVQPLKKALEEYLGYSLDEKNSSVEFTGSSISQGFYQQLRFALLIAFIFMGAVVFLIFRTPIPSLAVILAAFADIVMTIVTIDLLGISLSTGGIVALLMLIGYSVDTDILLTTRVLRKKEGTLNTRIYGAFKTGMTMTLTALIAVLASFLITRPYSDVLEQIFTILIIGLIFDILNTWVTNVSILKWYAEAKHIQ